mmetsp:Transcript_22143/g.39788  ORF Transcript_22143/g.39788 Transcript_22143/m.39788 type:complete len:1236 (+) Transcript_22143:70-3777(+)
MATSFGREMDSAEEQTRDIEVQGEPALTDPGGLVPNSWEKFVYGTHMGPCLPCCTFFIIGWLFTLLFLRKVVAEGGDIFTFEEPAVQGALLVQREYAFQAARADDGSGCGDSLHDTQETCEKDDSCTWEPGRGAMASGKCKENSCSAPSPPFRPRETALYIRNAPAWVGVVYEALEGRSILDDDILALIEKFEQGLGTDVSGAANSEGELSPWDRDWCVLAYPSSGSSAEPKCAPYQTLLNLFAMTPEGRKVVQEQVEEGFTIAAPFHCLCNYEDGPCSVCNADGTVKGEGTQDLLSAWPEEVSQCILQSIAAQGQTTTTTSRLQMQNECTGQAQAAQSRGSVSSSAQPAAIMQMVKPICSTNSSCQWSPPYTSKFCSSTAYYHATDGKGLVSGAEKENVLKNICNEDTLWFNVRRQVLPVSFSCASKRAQFARTFFFAGATSEDQDAAEDNFTKAYIEDRNGWYRNAMQLQAEIEREAKGKLRIMMYSGVTLLAQNLEILLFDGFLSVASLVLVWLYMWFTLESMFLASCGMFEIVFSLPVGMFFWTVLLGNKVYWYQLLVIYMILGIGADDVFILMDAWIQSSYNSDISDSKLSRFCWAYRRSFNAMLVTTSTTCGSFMIGAVSPLPQVQSFCIFAAVVVFVDWLFCVTFFASALLVFENYFKGYAAGKCCGISSAPPGKCLGPGFCWGCCRAIITKGGNDWRFAARPSEPGQVPQERSLEIFFSGPVFRFYRAYAWPLLGFWAIVVFAMAINAGVNLRVASERAPLGRENIDVMRGLEILMNEFTLLGNPTTSVVFGIDEENPIVWGTGNTANEARYTSSSAKSLKKAANQLELLDLCRAPDLGKDQHLTRCLDRSCVTMGAPTQSRCAPDTRAWRQHGYYMPQDMSCESSRYCFMEELAYFWASTQGNCKNKDVQDCGPESLCAWDIQLATCFSVVDAEDYPGLAESDFMSLLTQPGPSGTWDDYMKGKLAYLRQSGRSYDADYLNSLTGIRLNSDRSDIQFAWISYNASFPRQNTLTEAEEWYERWENFKDRHAPSLGGYQTADLYLFLVTQREMVKAAMLGILLSLTVTYIVMVMTTMNIRIATLGILNITAITCAFLGVLPIIGWSLGENECIFMIASVGLSVDYTVHLLHAYSSVTEPGRLQRAKGALAEMGISVANSAVTTLLAAAILFGCGFFFFFQFGGFIFAVIGLSNIMAFNLLIPLLVLFGPEEKQGSLEGLVCVKRRESQ